MVCMMKIPLLIAILAQAGAVPPAKAPLEANGPWTVHAENSLCLLSRTFGTGPDQIVIGFQPIFNEKTMELLIVSHDERVNQRIGDATVDFDPGAPLPKARYFSVGTKVKGQRYTRITVDSGAFALMQTPGHLDIDAPPLKVRVKIPASMKAIAAFRQCESDLLQSWGIDPAALSPERGPTVIGDPAKLFGPGSYPSTAVRDGSIGRVVAVLQLDASGVPTACRVVVGVAAALNDATCRQGMFVRYRPGRDAAGKPVASVAVLTVDWRQDG